MNDLERLRELSGLSEYKKVPKSTSRGGKPSLFDLPEFKRVAEMRNEGSLKAFSKKEIEDFFNAHDRSSKSTNN